MNNSTSILERVNSFILQENLCLSKIAKKAEVNAGTLSSIFNRNKIFTIDQLDRITAVMNLPEGHLYDQYIVDYLNESSPNWRRIRPFLYRCADLDKLDCIKKVVSLLMENLMYAPLLFDVAEDFFQTQKFAAARFLYESVAESEKQQHSERLALCKYRLFNLSLGNDQVKNQHAAIQFEPYLERLDEIDQLEALKDLANLYRSLRDWDKLEVLAKRMEEKGKAYYFSKSRSHSKDKIKKTSRPAFVYIAFPYLLLGAVYEARKQRDLALHFNSLYADLDWVKEKDEDTLYWKSLFKEWSVANIFVSKLFSGDVSILPDYVVYFESKDHEILVALLNIVEAANQHYYNVDDILQQFASNISNYLENQEESPFYSSHIISDVTINLSNELAEYYLRNEKYEVGYTYLLICLEKSSKNRDKSGIIKCVGLFELYKDEASCEVKSTYQKLIKEVYEHEKKINLSSDDI
ncbi:hypothetical protein FHR92_000463 [Fontibacillus solani]|uniref:DNA-binding protein n=1 Tax=Fontibacillus solani TaxID=1572857 RepID=A0A7W3SQ33_9BACL|nr:transcriptional regulator [Fontibacillus solani]MBA9084009.1 hypothetical protein [Fontibacillus solani]